MKDFRSRSKHKSLQLNLKCSQIFSIWRLWAFLQLFYYDFCRFNIIGFRSYPSAESRSIISKCWRTPICVQPFNNSTDNNGIPAGAHTDAIQSYKYGSSMLSLINTVTDHIPTEALNVKANQYSEATIFIFEQETESWIGFNGSHLFPVLFLWDFIWISCLTCFVITVDHLLQCCHVKYLDWYKILPHTGLKLSYKIKNVFHHKCVILNWKAKSVNRIWYRRL